jgi:hypothetical protein
MGCPEARAGATSVDRFPLAFEETTEAPESFPHVDMNVLSFASAISRALPRLCSGSQADRGHGAKL